MRTSTRLQRLAPATAGLFLAFGLVLTPHASAAWETNTLELRDGKGGQGAVPSPRESETARLQVIHNAADPAAALVDIYVDDLLALDDFAFRSATPYLNLPAERPIKVGVAGAGSAGVQDVLATFEFLLEAGMSYVAVANGVLDPGSFAANPEGRSIGFELFVRDNARESALDPSQVDFFALHGATDAPAVDVVARGVGVLVDGAAYGDLTDYLSVPAGVYVLDITPDSDNDVVLFSYRADLTTLAGGSAVVFASGFLNPAVNGSGEAFGLFAALADGTVIPLQPLTEARAQIIHNAADPAAASVDVYVNDTLALDDFAFRQATPYLTLPGNTDLAIGFAPPTSAGAQDVLVSFDVRLLAGETFVVFANGVLDPGSFAPNPEGRDTSFQLYVKQGAREAAADPGLVDFFVFHGVTDAPAVDVLTQPLVTLVEDAAYGDLTDYLSVAPAAYWLAVTDAFQTIVVERFYAPLSALGGGSAVVFASGFLNPGTTPPAEAFTLLAALADGTVIDLARDRNVGFLWPLLGSKLGNDSTSGGSADVTTTRGNLAFSRVGPNPFPGRAVIAFSLQSAEDVQLSVQDVTGRTVAKLANGRLAAGTHTYDFDAAGLPNGLYFYRLSGETFDETRKMVLSR